jgi:predicted small lipoprotein YifL
MMADISTELPSSSRHPEAGNPSSLDGVRRDVGVHISHTTLAHRARSVRPRRTALTSLAALATLSALSLAGCGVARVSLAGLQAPDAAAVVPSTSTRAPATITTWSALCQHVGDISALTVTRTDSPANHQSFGVPTPVSATDSAQARSVARTVCALTSVPAGTIYYCPVDWNVVYQLEFTGPRSAGQTVNADPSGCAWATLAGAPGAPMRRTTAAFWSGLGTAIGLRGATWRSFVGAPPN